MITLEQIRLLEGKITRAIDLIRVLKDENAALRKGLDSTQTRMKELESLVDGFKSDQREIESVIVRTLHSLDELEESAMAAKKTERPSGALHPGPAPTPPSAAPLPPPAAGRTETARPMRATAAEEPAPAADPNGAKEELDIF